MKLEISMELFPIIVGMAIFIGLILNVKWLWVAAGFFALIYLLEIITRPRKGRPRGLLVAYSSDPKELKVVKKEWNETEIGAPVNYELHKDSTYNV